MFHHAQCASLASTGAKTKLIRVTNQIYLMSLMCRIKNRLIKSTGSKTKLVRVTNQIYLMSLMCWMKSRLIKSKNSMVDGCNLVLFFSNDSKIIFVKFGKKLWELIHIHDGTCENLFKKYYDLQAVQKRKSWSNNKKIDPLLLTYLFTSHMKAHCY